MSSQTAFTLSPRAALLIIDMQNGFVHSQGTFGKLNMPVHRHSAIIPTIAQLRAAAHKAGVLVIFTRLAFQAGYPGLDSSLVPEVMRKMSAFVKGTWDSDVVDELAPDKSAISTYSIETHSTNTKAGEEEAQQTKHQREIVLDKAANSAFLRTDLDQILRSHGIQQLLFTGVGTNVCVECTVRDGKNYGYACTVISDATATTSDEEQAATMTNLKWFGDSATSTAVLHALEERASVDSRSGRY